MKKILLFCAALVAAMNTSAAITEMTCEQAKKYVEDNLQAGETATDSVAVTGFVTKDYSGLSRGQQRFSMDDAKGSVETLHCYYANMPENEPALNVGDKVTVKGLLQNYNGSAQIKNGDVSAIIERIEIKIDTIPSTVCEVIEEGEALNDQEKTTDYFSVEALVSSIKTPMNEYSQESFWMDCEDNEKQLQAYNVVMENGEEAKVGDKVFVLGRIQKYGTTIELVSGSAKVVEKGNVKIDTIPVTVKGAVDVAMALKQNGTTVDHYAVTGYVDSIAYEFKNGSMSFFMTDDMSNPTYDFQAYKVKTTEEIAAKVLVGAKVKVIAALKHYYAAATEDKPETSLAETVDGASIEILEEVLAVDNIRTDAKSVKRIENGQIIILRDGVRYNMLGTEIR